MIFLLALPGQGVARDVFIASGGRRDSASARDARPGCGRVIYRKHSWIAIMSGDPIHARCELKEEQPGATLQLGSRFWIRIRAGSEQHRPVGLIL
jgi:hypothetical protein